jgi:hypothetical protein
VGRNSQCGENTQRKPPVLERSIAKACVSAISVWGEHATRIARRNGIGINQLMAGVVEELLVEREEAFAAGYRAGRRPTPGSAVRPALRRAA